MRRTSRAPLVIFFLLFVGAILAVVAAPSLAPVRVQDGLPLTHLSDPLVASHVFLHVGRSCGVVQLVPVCFCQRTIVVLLLLASSPSAAPSLLHVAVQVLVLFGRRPIGEGAALRRRGVG